MILPEMDGGATFDCIRQISAGHTGYFYLADMPSTAMQTKFCVEAANGFIQKPYNISELSQKIKQVLDKSKGSTQE